MIINDVVIVGAGQAGLALGRCLTELGIDHVILERKRIAERWRSEVPPGLTLLTPNWMTRLPGWRYGGPDPDGFMARPDVVAFFEAYAHSFGAQVEEDTTVLDVRSDGGGFRVETTRGVRRCRALVIATGQCDRPKLPSGAGRLSPRVTAIHASRFRTAADLPPGGVLVVGASSSGVQIADELALAGRPVTIAVGRHIRMPRVYRGADVFRWMERAGILDDRVEDLPDPLAAARQPSMQLVGRADRSDIDLATLADRGVRVLGRLAGIEGERVGFADDLARTTTDADRRLRGVLDRFDAVDPPPAGTRRPAPLLLSGGGADIDLAREGIATAVFASGYARSFDWLRLPVVSAEGELVHRGGVTPVPGVYALGFRMLRRRNSNFIDGVGADAVALAADIAARLSASGRLAA
jgi:putative flavoprotein involved in K+ transport